VAVIGYALAIGVRRAKDVLGERVQIGSVTYTIVGVAPRDFVGTTAAAAPVAFVPLTTYALARDSRCNAGYSEPCGSWVEILVRRKPGVALAAATSDVSAALARSWNEERALSVNAFGSASEARVTGMLAQCTARGRTPARRVATWFSALPESCS
jgi:hypothetical protein